MQGFRLPIQKRSGSLVRGVNSSHGTHGTNDQEESCAALTWSILQTCGVGVVNTLSSWRILFTLSKLACSTPLIENSATMNSWNNHVLLESARSKHVHIRKCWISHRWSNRTHCQNHISITDQWIWTARWDSASTTNVSTWTQGLHTCRHGPQDLTG